jgi:hypothetical protein
VSGWAGASSLHAGEGGTSVRYKGMVDCFVRTWQEEGYRAFFKVPPARPAVPASSNHYVTARLTGVHQQHGRPWRLVAQMADLGWPWSVSLLCG